MGASVVVAEADPHRALEAHMDGFRVMDVDQAAACGDFFVTVTGNTSVLRDRHFRVMKDGAVLANAGHFDVEICLPDLEALAVEVTEPRANIRTYRMEDGRALNVLAEGRLVNLAAADGHPIEIMDLSFASQLLAARHILENRIEAGLYELPLELDREVARLKMESLGLNLEKLTPEQEQYLRSWEE
jgi:adenosylhomocysteinase